MPLSVYIAAFAVTTLFTAWVLFFGGADWLEGSFISAVVIDVFAPRWTAEGIKVFVGLSWLISAVVFSCFGLRDPASRF